MRCHSEKLLEAPLEHHVVRLTIRSMTAVNHNRVCIRTLGSQYDGPVSLNLFRSGTQSITSTLPSKRVFFVPNTTITIPTSCAIPMPMRKQIHNLKFGEHGSKYISLTTNVSAIDFPLPFRTWAVLFQPKYKGACISRKVPCATRTRDMSTGRYECMSTVIRSMCIHDLTILQRISYSRHPLLSYLVQPYCQDHIKRTITS